ncbi:MAG TPA: sigma 54-interacting transcriptional regulator [Vicinamibacterales bacterium]|nr:sigma 54-interacting transcriptional regulator [Vicinamibacterales bacterium]
MAGLLRDRYFEYATNQAWDLVTGRVVPTDTHDDVDRAGRTPRSLIEVLEHGVDGSPRWIVSDTGAKDWHREAQTIASEARRHGYVPLAVNVFLRRRLLLANELRTRAMVLFADPDAPFEQVRTALLHAAAMSPRPHVLMSVLRTAVARPAAHWQAAEARAVYGSEPAAAATAVAPREVLRLIEKASRAPEFVRSGRHAAAERLLRDVAAALVRRHAGASAAEIYIRLGRLLLERGKASAAESIFDEAAVHAEGSDIGLVVAARIWQAAARTDAGQLSAAESLCRAALVTCPSNGEERARAEATLARVLLWQGRAADACAMPFLHTITWPAFVSGTAIRLLVEAGDLFEAGRRARELVDRVEDDPVARVIAMTAHLRVLLAAGDLKVAEDQLKVLARAARLARSPLRLVRMRLQWIRALRRAGRNSDANHELRALSRIRSALPPLLRSAIDREDASQPAAALTSPRRGSAPSAGAAELVTLGQREADDRMAVKLIGDYVRRELTATRVECWTADAGPPTAVVASGAGLPTHLGRRALETGSVIGPEAVESGMEIAVPVRLGAQLLGALVARWSADRTPPHESTALMTLACAVAAPRVDALIHVAQQVTQAATAIPELVGVSAAMADVRRAVVRAAAAPFSVLIEGESGVGKELVARAIHQLGPRRDRRFCDVNCAALPDELLESELFGHARGAFTGAVSDRAGLIEEADGGTLFLDEVSDLSPRAQAKLLRVIQQQEVRRIGETFSRKLDVRFVSAANRDLRTEGEEGRFRHDLRYRLDVIRIRIPSLRERPEDVPSLARHFWLAASARVGSDATLTHGVLTALARYHWPGNVRELQNVMAALAVEAPVRGVVRTALLPAVISGTTSVTSARFSAARTQWERRFVEVALARAGGSRTRAARELGLTRQGLLKVLHRVGLQSTDSEKSTY